MLILHDSVWTILLLDACTCFCYDPIKRCTSGIHILNISSCLCLFHLFLFVIFRFSDIRLEDDRGIPTQDFLDSCYAIVPVLGRPASHLLGSSSCSVCQPQPQSLLPSLRLWSLSLIILLPAFDLPIVLYSSPGGMPLSGQSNICVLPAACTSFHNGFIIFDLFLFGTGNVYQANN